MSPLGGQTGTDSIQIAGIAYLASNADVSALFPTAVAMRAYAAESGSSLDRRFAEAMAKAGVPVSAGLANRTGVAVAFALDDEFRIVQPLADGTVKVITILSAQLISIDFNNMEIVSSFPLLLEYVDVRSGPPDDGYPVTAGRAMVRLFEDGPKSVFTQMAELYASVPQRAVKACRTRIGRVSFDEQTVRAAESRFGTDSMRVQQALRATFARYWIPASRQSLIPASNSQAQNQMVARFSDAEVYQLKIPDPDFELDFVDMRTRFAEVGRSASRRVDGTMVQLQAGVHLVLDANERKPIAAGTFRHVELDTVAVNAPPADPWPSVINSVKTLTARLALSTRQRDAAWFKKNDMTGTAFPSLSDWLLKQCTP